LASLAEHWGYLEAEWQAAQAAPLSLRRTMLVAALLDAYADRLFAAALEADDILVFRAELAAAVPALGQVFELCAQRVGGPRLVVEAVSVATSDLGALPVEDFMVSLYNDHTVQRVVVAWPDGQQRLAHDVLGEAMVALSPHHPGV
jgi:hypothetical protein